MFEFDGEKRKAADGLFLERLDAFMDRSMSDLKAFADRESLSLEETRLYVAEWHSRYLFQSNLTAPDWSGIVSTAERQAYIRTTLCDVSRILENLKALSGVHSFVLAVDPTDPAMDGFLGGSWLGRDFWRNLRTGGDSGAKAFKGQCVKHLQATGESSTTAESSHITPAHALKSELYDKVRTSLRNISGKKHAEMKWTNPDKLVDSYGVMLVGWPPSIPYQNPSTMKVGQKKELIALLDSGAMRFEKINPGQTNLPSSNEAGNDDYSWALQFTNEEQTATPRIQRSRTPEGAEGMQDYEGDDTGPRKRLKTVASVD